MEPTDDGAAATEMPSSTKTPLWVRIGKRIAVVFVACVFIPLCLLYVFQDRIVYVTGAEVLPIDQYLPGAREVSYQTADGIALQAWFVPSRQPTAACGPAPTVLMFHGTGGNRSWQYPLASAIAAHGSNVFIAEYRGFGGTDGSPSEDGLITDARAALDAARRMPEVAPDRIVYLGFSLGTGVAVQLAVESPPPGLVLLAPYTSLPDVAWTRLPGLPYRWLMRSQFETISHIRAVQAPLLVIVGTADEVIPNDQSAAVYAAAPRPDGYIELPGLTHVAVDGRAGDLAIAQLSGFVHGHAACGPS